MNIASTQQRAIVTSTGFQLASIAAATLALLLAGCGDDKDKASQTAAKVNKEEITVHEINFVLQRQQGLKPEQAEAASHQVLERLIEQQLAVSKAQDEKLDRDPRVVQQLEMAKKEILARAYVEHLGESVAKPTSEEIAKYYDEKPALFKERRIYSFQEIGIEAPPEQFDEIRAKLNAAKNINEFVDYLKSKQIRFAGSQAVRAAEQLPLASLDAIARLKDGDSLVTRTPTGLMALYLAGSRSQPVSAEQARPAIEAFLWNQRKTEAVQKDMKAMRDAAKIEYVGKFAPTAASAPASAPAAAPSVAPTVAPTAVPAASSALDTDAISKGLK
ncbi:MAG: EpsD family peptidyl-prolyl cis-trans isomerase [Paucibacter sp.]|nr:EpsD family peptidyl-prolyl cis-trans isomerase [Roseateles sp.]